MSDHTEMITINAAIDDLESNMASGTPEPCEDPVAAVETPLVIHEPPVHVTSTTPVTKAREGGPEMGRLILMVFVICHHYLVFGTLLYQPDLNPKPPYTAEYGFFLSRLFFDSVFIVGVDCFVFISGYYGIRLRARTIIILLLQIFFYNTIFWIIDFE